MRVKYTTTLNEETLKALEIIRLELGLIHKNDVIEHLVKEYINNNETVEEIINAYNKKTESK
jgi:hypothetical protein